MIVDAVLPAGGRISGEFASRAGTEIKALTAFDGKTVLENTVRALRSTDRIGKIVVVGPDEIRAHPTAQMVDAVLPEGGDSGPANILAGLDWLSQKGKSFTDRVLIVATDLPFISADAVNNYMDNCTADADVCVPLVSRNDFETRFPGSELEYVKLTDGQWTMGCAFYVNPRAIMDNYALIERLFELRKSQLGMVRVLGLEFVLRFLFKRMAICHIEKRCCEIIGCRGCAIHGSDPVLAYDLDKVEEYLYAADHLIGTRSYD